MNIAHLTNAIPMVRKKKEEQLAQLICSAIEDWVISKEEQVQINALASELGLTEEDIEKKLQKKFRNKFQKTIEQFASDGKISIAELTALKQRAVQIGMSENDMQILIDEALHAHSQKEKEHVKEVITGIAVVAVAAAGIIGLGALLVADAKNSAPTANSSDNRNTNYSIIPSYAGCKEICAYCGKKIPQGYPVFKVDFQSYCCQKCAKHAMQR